MVTYRRFPSLGCGAAMGGRNRRRRLEGLAAAHWRSRFPRSGVLVSTGTAVVRRED